MNEEYLCTNCRWRFEFFDWYCLADDKPCPATCTECEDYIEAKPAKHPYTCEITGQEVDRPCWECELDSNCKWRPKNDTFKNHENLKVSNE